MECPYCKFDIQDAPSGFTVGSLYQVTSCPSCGGAVSLVHECNPDLEWINPDGETDSAPGCIEYYEKAPTD